MVEIIAEAAQGYLGAPLEKSLALVDVAAAAGADAVKFQVVFVDEVCRPGYVYYDLFGDLRMEQSQWQTIADRCAEKNIKLYCDVFGETSLEVSIAVGAEAVKLHSTDLLNIPLMKKLAASDVSRVILSTGGSMDDEIRAAVEILKDKNLVLMHGFQGYPTNNEDNQIARINWLHENFPEYEIGFADHVKESDDERLWMSAIAVGAGVHVLEKHITRASVLRDEDYEAALGPDEFYTYVNNMRLASAAFGGWEKKNDFGMSESELKYRKNMKKHVVANRDFSVGDVVTDDDLLLLRTGEEGNILHDLNSVIGKTMKVDCQFGQAIKKEYLK